MKFLLLAGAAALLLPAAGNAAIVSYSYSGAEATIPYQDWNGDLLTRQTGWLDVDTSVFGDVAGRSYTRSYDLLGEADRDGISLGFAFGLFPDTFSVVFDGDRNIAAWSAGNVWEGPTLGGAYFSQADSIAGHHYFETLGFDTFSLFSAPPGSWTRDGASPFEPGREEVAGVVNPIPLPAAGWMLLGGLGLLGVSRRWARS